MSDGIIIEIVGNYKERYQAKIHSFSGENELIVKFDDNPEVLCKVPIGNVLMISDHPNKSKTSDFQVGCDVLAFRKLDDTFTNISQFNNVKLSHAWWPAKIDKLKGCFAAIQFMNKDNDAANDIVELTALRPLHDGRPLLRNDICVHEMLVPDDLCEFCEHYDVRGDLHRWCGQAIVVNFDRKQKKLLIFSTDKEVVRRASLLDASFMRVLRQKKLIHMQKDELTKRLNDTIKNQYTEEFTVAEELMGLAIGSQGCNIKKARDIEGVISIDLDDHIHTFVISAHTQEACKAARAQLEYTKKVFYVPMDIVSKVIGRNGNQIQDIIDQSGVMRVRVVEGHDLYNWKDDENADNVAKLQDHIPFVFVGNANSIRDACLLLEFSIDHHREMDRLQKERDEIQREIISNQASANFPHTKYINHSVNERGKDDHYDSEPSRGYNQRGRNNNRGRSGYKNVSNSNVEQRNDSFNDDAIIPSQQKYRGNSGRPSPYRRGAGASGYRQGSLPPTSNGQHNDNRRYHQFEDDTDEYASAANESDSGVGRGGGGHMKYRGNNKGGRGGGGRGVTRANNHNNNNNNQSKVSRNTETDGSGVSHVQDKVSVN